MDGPATRVVLARRTRAASVCWRPLRKVLLGILGDHDARGVLSIAVVDDEAIREVHREFLGVDASTDVISFDLGGGPEEGPEETFGEVVVSAETAGREAVRRRLSPDVELALYAIHGTLHLVGFDDRTETERRRMRRMERKYVCLYKALADGGGRLERTSVLRGHK